jgi:hypothetical protein
MVGLSQQVKLMTTNFSATAMPWTRKSKLVGYSAICYAGPALVLRGGTGIFARVFSLLWCLQVGACFWSDYTWTGRAHVSHGVDRWLASSLLVAMVVLASSQLSVAHALAAAALPLYCLRRGKLAVAEADWPRYVVWHSMWHLTGPVVACAVLVRINAVSSVLA